MKTKKSTRCVTVSEFAAHMQVKDKAVYKDIQSGRIDARSKKARRAMPVCTAKSPPPNTRRGSVTSSTVLRETYLKEKLQKKSFAKAYKEEGRLMEVAVAIANARERTGLSQAQLAKKLKTSQSVVSRIENGNQNLSLKMLAKIADVLRCELTIKLKPQKLAV